MFVIEVPYFNLDQIYNSCQTPRWIKLRDLKYVVFYKDKALKIEQQKQRLILSCSEEDFYDIWFEYFDLRTDYLLENNKIKRLGGKFKVPANRGNGIHILKQDPFEAYVFTKLVDKVGYDKTALAIRHIAEICGVEHSQSMREVGRVVWHEFPTPEMILKKIDDLKKMGKINAWLKKLCEAIINDGYDFENQGNDLFELLANRNMSVFPLYELEEVIEKNFDCVAEEFADWYLDELENKGLLYMYILHHVMNPPKEIKSYGVN